MELQEKLDDLKQRGIRVCAISYDPVEVLAGFAEKHGITYPLLSDVDSTVIRLFGIFNTHIPEGHPWYGVPYPGSFMVGDDGTVIERSFYASHGVRDSVPRLVEEGFGVRLPESGPSQTFETNTLRATARLSSAVCRPGQVLSCRVEFEVADGCHIQARSLPEGYVPTTLTFQDEPGVRYGDVEYPPGRNFRLEALGETLHVYEGTVTLKASVRCSRKEPFTMKARLGFQACDERTCHPPERIDFSIPVECQGNVQ